MDNGIMSRQLLAYPVAILNHILPYKQNLSFAQVLNDHVHKKAGTLQVQGGRL